MTLKEFDELPLGKVFAMGVLPNSPEGLFMTNSHLGEELLWIAKRGWGHDWAIYCHWSFHTEEWVEKNGDKVTREEHIKRCVPCDDEVFKLYRY